MIRFDSLPLSALVATVTLTAATLTPVAGHDVAPELAWETSGFVAPESVVFDAERQQFYVSNMGSWRADSTPGDGFISRVSAEGRLLDLRWVVGLESPKGLALANGRLYVGDDAELVEIDPATGTITARYAPVDGPGGFNDCTADPMGNVYVFSRRLATVFRLHGGQFEAWATIDASKTGWPNGLHAEPDRLLLGSWVVSGPNGQEQLGHLSTVSYADRLVGRLGDQPIGHIDGIEPDGRGGYTVTAWTKGDVVHVSAGGTPTPLMTLRQGAADHEYVIDRRLLVIPLVLDNVIRAYRWEPAGSRS